MDFSFSKKNRIQHRKDFQHIYSHGVKQEGSFAYLYLIQSTPPPRLGMTVSRKVGNAVVRSQIKRHYREAFRMIKDQLKAPVWIVVNVKPVARGVAGMVLREDFYRQLRRLNYLGDQV